jgi:hypothetical protein
MLSVVNGRQDEQRDIPIILDSTTADRRGVLGLILASPRVGSVLIWRAHGLIVA